MFYWQPAFFLNNKLVKTYWSTIRMQKLHQNIIFFRWNFFNNTIVPFFFIQATDVTTYHSIINGNFIFFFWMKTGCKLGSPDNFGNGKPYSDAITQGNEWEPGIVSDLGKLCSSIAVIFNVFFADRKTI